MIDYVVAKRWRHSGAVPLTRSASRKKLKGRKWYFPQRLRGDTVTRTMVALDSSFNLLLISRILVDEDGNCRRHVIIEINHGFVCVVDINSLVCCLTAVGCARMIARCGETTHSGVDVNNTYLFMINPLTAHAYTRVYIGISKYYCIENSTTI